MSRAAQTSQVVCDRPGVSWLGFAEQWSQMLGGDAVSECCLDENKRSKTCNNLDPRISEAQRSGALTIHGDSLCMSWNDASPMKQSWPMVGRRADVGCRKADLAQFLKIFDASADRESAGVVDGRFSSKRLSLLWYCLMRDFL